MCGSYVQIAVDLLNVSRMRQLLTNDTGSECRFGCLQMFRKIRRPNDQIGQITGDALMQMMMMMMVLLLLLQHVDRFHL